MNDITVLSPQISVWGTVISLLPLVLILWFGLILLLGSWKLFRFLITWKP